ncbi:MAG: hypothetical protein ABIS47_13640 [Acidimicrobiales bacterium]
MRQALAILAAALLAALGAVVLGEYDLRGVTAVVGFPLYGLAVAEVALAVGRHLSPAALVGVAGVAAAGLTWALWISFGHFRNGAMPPVLSWVMVAAATTATLGWCWSGRRRHRSGPDARTAATGLP